MSSTESNRFEPVITSFLDTDLYKITMQAAIYDHFRSGAEVRYLLYNRTEGKKLTPEAIQWLSQQIDHLATLFYSDDEIRFLEEQVPTLPKRYLEFLKTFKVNPSKEVKIQYDEKTHDLVIEVIGEWLTTIYYEIPVLALVSEAYFKFVDKDWAYEGQLELAAEKTKRLIDAECFFSEFGTRRRRSKKSQDLVIQGIAQSCNGSQYVTGTSNVHFAKKYNLKPVGTVAHEWFMGIAAYTQDYLNANKKSLELWLETFGDKGAGFALSDTFGTDSFLKSFVRPLSDSFVGVRQDSGDPLEYTKKIAAHYKSLGYPPASKRIIYSDSLNIEKCIQYKKAAEDVGLLPSFGIGTFFTNDFKSTKPPYAKSEPMNIVMKIDSVNGKPAVKLSDNLSKNTGDKDVVLEVKKILGYVERDWKEGDEAHRWKN